jgi:hypothetical protein
MRISEQGLKNIAAAVSASNKRRAIHSKSHTRIYQTWSDMWQRCSNPRNRRYGDYGGRGISVCQRWESFQAFWSDMGDKPIGASLDRIDNGGIYEPVNCRWASRVEQQRNRRGNRYLTWNGKTQTVAAWAEQLGIKTDSFRSRLVKGWSLEKVMTFPYRRRGV